MGRTMIEKILARSSGAGEVKVGDIVFARPHMILSHDNSAAISKIFEKLGAKIFGSTDNMRTENINRGELRTLGSSYNLQEIKFKD